MGTARGLETKLVPEAGFPLGLIRVGQLKNVSLATRAKTMTYLPMSVLRCVGLLRTYRPGAVVGVGGYASGPAMMAAILLGIPTLAFEPNAVPGLANRLIGRRVSAAAVNFSSATRYFRNAVVTGIPVRKEFFTIARRENRERLRLLVFGGSQGARVLNEVMPQIAKVLLERYGTLQIVHQVGGSHGESVRAAYGAAGVESERLKVAAYLDEMVEEIGAADVVLCRSGASTVAELAAAGRASVLVPFAAAADDHQRKNADVLVEAGAARIILERALTPTRVLGEITELLDNAELRDAMGVAARRLAHEDATARIATLCAGLVK